MVRKLIAWAVNNPLIVFAYITVVIGMGIYSYTHINVEAYPDPAPPIIELTANNPAPARRRWNASSPSLWKSTWRACPA